MTLRNVLLAISLIIVGFCLSLYFQTAQNVNTLNWDQYQNVDGQGPQSHSLEELEEKIRPYSLEAAIREISERNRLAGEKTRVMELGPGDGRVLMELRKKFPQIELYGINKEKSHEFYRRESYLLTGLKYNIFNKSEIEAIELPFIVFQDLDFGARIPYDERKFDIVFSQNTLNHIKYKFELLNEVMRVLKPGGLSFHTDVRDVKIYAKGVVIEFRDALAEMRRRGIDIRMLENPESILFKKPSENLLFPVAPHQPLPTNLNNLTKELRRPDMGYNIQY